MKTKSETKKHIEIDEDNKYPTQQLKRDPENRHLYTNGEIRVLTVDEYKRLERAIPKDEYKRILEILMITGMRYIELQRLFDNPSWYMKDRNIIHLAADGQKKHARVQKERTINLLPDSFRDKMDLFYRGCRPPEQTSWNRDLQRWSKLAGIHPYGISAKTTRKSIESYMVVAGIPETTICLRAGHTSVVSMQHYQGLAFSSDERNDIKKLLKKWDMIE